MPYYPKHTTTWSLVIFQISIQFDLHKSPLQVTADLYWLVMAISLRHNISLLIFQIKNVRFNVVTFGRWDSLGFWDPYTIIIGFHLCAIDGRQLLGQTMRLWISSELENNDSYGQSIIIWWLLYSYFTSPQLTIDLWICFV